MAQLTPREREVLRLLMAGKRQREIADELCVTLRTVKAHAASMRGKAGARTTVELAARAAGEGE